MWQPNTCSYLIQYQVIVLPWWLGGKEHACQGRRHRRCKLPLGQEDPLARNSNLLQYSCLEKPKERGAWWAMVHGVAESDK